MRTIKIFLVIAIVGYIAFSLISSEINHERNVEKFCKEQCNFYSDEKKWQIDLGWFFDDEEVESRKATRKSFDEKDLDECINYCKELEDEFKYLTR